MRIRDVFMLLLLISLLFSCDGKENTQSQQRHPTVTITQQSTKEAILVTPFDMTDHAVFIKEAIDRGVVVNQRSQTSNVYSLHLFERAYKANLPAEVEVMMFSFEGEAILKRVIFEGGRIEVVQGIAGEIYFDDLVKTKHSDHIRYELTKAGKSYPLISIKTNQEVDLAGLVIEAFEASLDIDPALNHGMLYIAIDTSALTELSEEDLKRVLKHFEHYGLPVKASSFESLKEQGLVDERMAIKGILLSVDSLEIKEEVLMQVTKFKSGLAAVGVQCLFDIDALYQLKEAKMTWIS